MIDRTGQVWEVDLDDAGFSYEDDSNVILYYVVGASHNELVNGWTCLVMKDNPFERAGSLMRRSEFTPWEDRPTQFRRLA